MPALVSAEASIVVALERGVLGNSDGIEIAYSYDLAILTDIDRG